MFRVMGGIRLGRYLLESHTSESRGFLERGLGAVRDRRLPDRIHAQKLTDSHYLTYSRCMTDRKFTSPLTNLPLLGDEFDPWYVLLSPPETQKHHELQLLRRPQLQIHTAMIDYKQLTEAVENQAKNIVRNRWRDIRSYSPEEQAAIVLSSKQLRAGNSLGVKEYLLDRFRGSSGQIAFTLPSFPFKVPNFEKVVHRNLDAGEILCLKRLHLINCITTELLDRPSRFIIISDGKIYSDVCDIEPCEYGRYSDDARRVIARMGLTDHLSYVDMIDDVIGDRIDEFNLVQAQVESELESWWSSHRKTDRVLYLINNMKANINRSTEDYNLGIVARSGNLDSEYTREYREIVSQRAEMAAFTFMKKLVTLRIIDAVQSRYPSSIRATVHPKQGQYGIHLVNSSTRIFPWQGTTIRRSDGEFRVTTTADAWARAKYEVRNSEDGSLLYYSESELPDGVAL